MKARLSKVDIPDVFAFGWDIELQYVSWDDDIIFPEAQEEGIFSLYRDFAASEFKSEVEKYSREDQRNLAFRTRLGLEQAGAGGRIKFDDVLMFNEKQWKNLPIEFSEMGCMPDKNIYGMKTKMKELKNRPVRSCGGHIHIGVKNSVQDGSVYVDLLNKKLLVENLDKLLAVVNVVYNRRNALTRRELYGLPGTYRPKEYGVEYRTLDNSWFPIGQIFDMTIYLTQLALEYACREESVKAPEGYLDCILADDQMDAKKVFTEIISLADEPKKYKWEKNNQLASVKANPRQPKH